MMKINDESRKVGSGGREGWGRGRKEVERRKNNEVCTYIIIIIIIYVELQLSSMYL